jgi:signal transduction histidine kinase
MTRKQVWRYLRAFATPAVLWGLVFVGLWQVLPDWLHGDETYDDRAMREWIDEARVFRDSLPEMVDDYLKEVEQARNEVPGSGLRDDLEALRRGSKPRQPLPQECLERDLTLLLRVEKIEEHLKALGNPPTKMYPGQLILFPTIYRLEVRFDDALQLPPIVWDSDLPRHESQFRELPETHSLVNNKAHLHIQYQLHAYRKRQRTEQTAARRLRWVLAIAIAGSLLTLLWWVIVTQREAERERQRAQAQHQVDQAEHLRMEEELRRKEIEGRHAETERKLLEQRLATQNAERQALELKSQLYASIGIMAGSYAHNIKNLLVRPNDLLRRCLESGTLPDDQEQMLHEVRQTLGTVTERLQQILRTVRRDPGQTEQSRLDLNEILRDLGHTWRELARERWKMELTLDLSPEPLWVEGDLSHLQQAVENLLFNARDATFEMRNHYRDLARKAEVADPAERRQALIEAASWKGQVTVRTRREGRFAILEVRDNGVGMTDEVRRRCTETHFSTKRDNALFEGHSTGMGLGLSFVVAILEHHNAPLDIASEPLEGATFRVRFSIASD